MHTPSVLTISVPPTQMKRLEKLAHRQSRTVGELAKEALREYERSRVKRPASFAEAIDAIRADAKAKGTDKMTMRQINAVVAEVRAEAENKKASRRRTR